jgi:peptidoglycan/xylan/chitin deacetylase (PgdA/CDA1 family)
MLAGVDGAETGLSSGDVRRLVETGLSVGFHTLRHYDLRTLDDEALARALRDGKPELERAAGRAVDVVAYPHRKCDARVAEAARAAGFRLGFTGDAQAVRAMDDPLRLGRLQPPRGSLADFALQLTTALRKAAR